MSLVIFAPMDIRCTDTELQILKKIASAASSLGVSTYVVGGFVRDKLLNRPTKDIDVVCVGNGVLLAEKAAAPLSK